MAHSPEEMRLSYRQNFHRLMEKARQTAIRCNIFWSDDPEEARQFLDTGIDTILTNDYHRIRQALQL